MSKVSYIAHVRKQGTNPCRYVVHVPKQIADIAFSQNEKVKVTLEKINNVA